MAKIKPGKIADIRNLLLYNQVCRSLQTQGAGRLLQFMLFLEACAEQVEPRFCVAHITPKTAVLKRKISGLITRLFCAERHLPYFIYGKGYGCLSLG